MLPHVNEGLCFRMRVRGLGPCSRMQVGAQAGRCSRTRPGCGPGLGRRLHLATHAALVASHLGAPPCGQTRPPALAQPPPPPMHLECTPLA